jgi:hypothetical protein
MEENLLSVYDDKSIRIAYPLLRRKVELLVFDNKCDFERNLIDLKIRSLVLNSSITALYLK